MCVHICVPHACLLLDLVELGLVMVCATIWMMGIEPGSSERASALTYGVIFPTPTLKLLQGWLVLGDHVGEICVTHEKANYCNSTTTSWLLSLCLLRDWDCAVLNLFFYVENTQPRTRSAHWTSQGSCAERSH